MSRAAAPELAARARPEGTASGRGRGCGVTGVLRPGVPGGRASRSTRSRTRSRRTTRSRAAAAPSSTSKWDFIGPDTLDVDRLGTQSFIKPTQWSGRVTALTVDPKCKPHECTLYVGRRGRRRLADDQCARRRTRSGSRSRTGIPTNAIGSIAVDPNDPTGKTIYVGTGEGNASGDSEAGLGLYKTTDGGYALVARPGLVRRRQPPVDHLGRDPAGERAAHPVQHALRHAGRGLQLDEHGHRGAASPPLGVYNSTDGGAIVRADAERLRQRGQVRPE